MFDVIIIRVPGLSYEDSLYLMDSLVDDTDPMTPITIHKRRYTIEDALDFLEPYHVTGNIYEVESHPSWNSFIKDKDLV